MNIVNTEVPVAVAMIIAGMLGGMNAPSSAEDVITAAVNSLG